MEFSRQNAIIEFQNQLMVMITKKHAEVKA
jgi:hypothetical protein